MYFQQLDDRQFVVRLARGEKIVDTLKQFCAARQIEGGFFSGIGAVDWVELALYDVAAKQYHTQVLQQAFEITNIAGNIAMSGEERIVHAHVTLSDQRMQAFGGHLVDGRVSGTLELVLTKTVPLAKKRDQETGLNVLDLSEGMT